MLEPHITTGRLLLRSFDPADAPQVQSLYGDWNVLRMLLDEAYPYPDGQAARWIATHHDLRAAGIHYPLAIEFEGRCVGYVGLRPNDQSCVIGYWLGVRYWRRGLMSEAVAAVVDFAFNDLSITGLRARHRLDNEGSSRILDKLGFIETERGTVASPSCMSECVAIWKELTRDRWSRLAKLTDRH